MTLSSRIADLATSMGQALKLTNAQVALRATTAQLSAAQSAAATDASAKASAAQTAAAADATSKSSAVAASVAATFLPKLAVITTSVDTSLTASGINRVDASGGPRTATLPSPLDGKQIVIVKSDTSSNAVTVSGHINGTAASSINLVWYQESILFASDGATWYAFAGHKRKSDLDLSYGQALNVKAFPFYAKGDGATDDTAAIHLARDAAALAGVPVYFGSGTFVTAGIAANKPGQTWILSPGATVIPTASSTTPVFVVSGSRVTITGGGTIDGAASTSPNCAGIYTNSGSSNATPIDDLTVENITIKNTGGYGIQAIGNRTVIRGNRITNTTANGINVGASTSGDIVGPTIERNIVDRSGVSASTLYANIFVAGTAGGAQKVQRTAITGNVCLMPTPPNQSTGGEPIGIEVQRGAVHSVIAQNRLYGGGMGISVAGASNSTAVTGNIIHGPSWYGIELASSSNCIVSGNTIDGAGVLCSGASSSTAAIVVNYQSQFPAPARNIISTNTIYNLAAGATNSSAGIAFAGGGGEGNVVNANTIETVAHGISIVSATRTVITNNRLYGASGATSNGIWYNQVTAAGSLSGNVLDGFATGVQVTMNGGVFDLATISANVFNVTVPYQSTLTGGATVGSAVTFSGNRGSGVANTANAATDPGGTFVSNAWYGPTSGAYATAAPPVNSLTAHALPVSRAAGLTIWQIGLTVTTAAASSTVRVGIYKDNGSGQPGALVQEITTFDTSATGNKTYSLPATLALPPGMYWVAAVAQGGTPTLGCATGKGLFVAGLGPDAAHTTAYTQSNVTGALPATFGTPSGTNFAISTMVRST